MPSPVPAVDGGTMSGPPRARIEGLDAIRGVALLGIFLMNIEWFSRPMQEVGLGPASGLAPVDAAAGWAVYALIQGKFWILFSLLFGMGFAVMQARVEAGPRAFLPAYLRRLGVLLALGVAHAVLLWPGDILHSYAIAGLAMLAFRELEGRLLWIVGGLLYLLVAALSLLGGLLIAMVPSTLPDPGADAAAAALAYAQGDFAAVTAQRLSDFLGQLGNEVIFLLSALGVFLVGMWCVRSGAVVDPPAHRALLRRMAAFGAPLGVALTALAVWIALRADAGSGGRYLALGVMLFANLPLALAYLALLALGLARMPRLRAWFAPAGRMALTNYILQSLVASLVFYGYGAGLYGQIGRAGQCGIVLAVFAAQLVASRWWMARFAYGPLEWLWRAATWLHWPPLRRRAAGA